MEQNLRTAKMAIALNKKETITDKVLAEIIHLSNSNSYLSYHKITHTIPEKLNISSAMYRKSMFKLFKMKAIKKDGITILLNQEFFNV